MHFALTLRLVGMLLILYSLTLLPPILIAMLDHNDTLWAFVATFAVMLFTGSLLWFRRSQKNFSDLQVRDGFIVIVVFWVVLSAVSALPFLAIQDLTFSQALFEAVSGFTTTGATVIKDIDMLPDAILYYRQQLQFLGGLGVIVLAIAILPMLGLGGYQLSRAEAPGPMRDEKLSPRVAHAAKVLLIIYFGLTILCAIAYKLAGMTWFDAVAHSYTTVSTSGFSTHDASIGHFDSVLIESIAIVFMILGSLNFTLHYLVLHKKDLSYYRKDAQSRVFINIILVLVLITTVVLYVNDTYPLLESLRKAAFQVVSLITTSGFTTADYSLWPMFLPVLVFGSGFIGGCVGSTAGGFKIVRIMLLYKQGMRELMRLIHPNAVIQVRIGERVVSERVASAVLGFTFMYIASFLILSLLMMATGLDIVEAFAATAACINTVGPGLGGVTANFSSVSDAGLWISAFAMILGRLEIFALLVVLTPAFWRQ